MDTEDGWLVQFFHTLPFSKMEKGLLTNIIKPFAEERGAKIGTIYVNKRWVYFDVDKPR